MSKQELMYRILFVQKEVLYELYAEFISEETLIGFIEAENIIFGDNSPVVEDPNEERLKNEFKGVKRCYIPLHTIIRIDEVMKAGPVEIHPIEHSNISHFPPSIAKRKPTAK